MIKFLPFGARWTIVQRAFACLALSLLLAGCGKGRPPEPLANGPQNAGLIVGDSCKTIADMAPADVIVSVNGVVLTRQAYDAMLQDLEKTIRASNPKIRSEQLALRRERRARRLVSEFLTKQVLVQEARRRNIKPTPEHRAALKGLLATLAKAEGLKVEELASSKDPAAQRILGEVEEQALILALREAEFGDKLKVTEADMQVVRERVSRYNAMCEQTNALVLAKAQATCERLRKGDDFMRVANEVSEATDDETKGVWGTFSSSEVDDEALRHAAFTLPVGAFSQPFDVDEGLVIIKVLERKGVDTPVAMSEATVKLGRILLRLGETMTVPKDNVLRQQIESARLESLQRPWLDQLQKQARVEFPNGTNFWKSAKKEAKE